MALIRWSPARDLLGFPSGILNMQQEINRMFDGFLRGGIQDDNSLESSLWVPSVDVSEFDEEFVVKVELPGVNKDDVKITLEDSILTIRGEKKQEHDTKKSNYRRVERSFGSFQRSFTLPATVKADKIDAEFKDGVLRISLPKAEEAVRKQIDVKVK